MNPQEKQREQLNRAHNNFRDMVARGQTGAIDRFGRRIEVGDKVLLKTDVDLIFTVVDVGPCMDPRQPPGLMDVKMQVTFALRVPAGEPYRTALITSKAAAAETPGPGADGSNGQPAEPEKPAGELVPFRPTNLDEPPT